MTQTSSAGKTSMTLLLTLSTVHLLNDAVQMVIPAIYPMIKESYQLSFSQIGFITLAFQLTASVLQPVVGHLTDKKSQPYSMVFGMCFTLIGLLSLAYADSFILILISVVFVGLGSSIFHPESSRIARYASGGKAATAQSIFQVGGKFGTAIGPLLAAAIIVPLGQTSIRYFGILALLSIFILWRIGRWAIKNDFFNRAAKNTGMDRLKTLPKQKRNRAIAILVVLIFSKFFYLASMKNYLTFYLIDRFEMSVQNSQILLFLFLLAGAVGTILGGPLGDKIGRKKVIWFSILGAAPFALFLPYADLFWTITLFSIIALIISSAFPAIIVYGQELLPKNLGMVSGLFYGLGFGMGAIGAAVLGSYAEHTSIYQMFWVVSFLPLLGLFATFLPNLRKLYTE